MRRLPYYVGWFVFCGFLFVPALVGQERIRTLEFGEYRKYDISTEPVAIVGRSLGDKPFLDETHVLGGPDWLRDLVLTLKNVSSKPIKRCVLHLLIPDQGNIRIVQLGFPDGVVDGPPTLAGDSRKALWAPGLILKVKVHPIQLKLLDRLREKGVSNPQTVSLALHSVIFEDGSGWLQGIPTHEDPSRPGSMIPDRVGTLGDRSSFLRFLDHSFNRPPLGGLFRENHVSIRSEGSSSDCAWFVQRIPNGCGTLHGNCAATPEPPLNLP